MNFETKYLIRWGIPGWVFLLMSLWPFVIFSKGVPVNDPVKSISFIFSTAVIGVVIGYLIYQVYFAYDWLLGLSEREFINGDELSLRPWGKWYHFNKRSEYRKYKAKQYYKLEFEWQNELSKITDENKRTYIATRFSHLLSTTHSLGALCWSLFISLFVNLFHLSYSITYVRTLLHTGSIVLNCILILLILLPSIANQKYYSRNVNAFRMHFLNEFKK
ncbi:hypothetical protein QI003_09200 [Bacillus stercoris]|uniref:hypothetical protein n=1 Tax=Bacillus stercoris TaxID=2054641 RepID=UPI001D092E5D|nr:hypothetical protein [Bacillus stercoris]MCB7153003.1 hypothetical protein [Bacillus stercoris]MEC2059272.1 hypothetical protein [Bacillus stercoris]WGV93416.1 hypothetical protein QI003_12625 [Bacillus stercoris]WGV97184.1 hypothetical protein QI003_09200 [Bacillus stercoris]WIL36131.1 hypothetical protein QPZ67_04210 [Bacillus stercoris]